MTWAQALIGICVVLVIVCVAAVVMEEHEKRKNRFVSDRELYQHRITPDFRDFKNRGSKT